MLLVSCPKKNIISNATTRDRHKTRHARYDWNRNRGAEERRRRCSVLRRPSAITRLGSPSYFIILWVTGLAGRRIYASRRNNNNNNMVFRTIVSRFVDLVDGRPTDGWTIKHTMILYKRVGRQSNATWWYSTIYYIGAGKLNRPIDRPRRT